MEYDFRQKAKSRFVLHVYKIGGDPNEYFYEDMVLAQKFAKVCFRRYDVYKVKMWDLEKGPIEPNNPNARALVFELK